MQQASSQAKFELNGKGMLRRADCPWKPHSLANQSIHGAVDEEASCATQVLRVRVI